MNSPSQAPVQTSRPPVAGAAAWLMPALGDVLFCALLLALTVGGWSAGLLSDADTGWHIRNGEQILRTHSVPRVDSFSYTRAGQPWFSWEWLYDAQIAAIHARAGLNGVVLESALLIALTFTLVFRMALRRSRHMLIAALLTVLAVGASDIHFLARPHLCTLLFTVVWFALLSRGDRWLWLMPPLMVLWVNLHGGFVFGLMLIAVSCAGEAATALAGSGEQRSAARQSAFRLARVGALCALATLVTPYGWRLHSHVAGYLGSRFMMDNISEFLSPNFHGSAQRMFAVLLLVAIAAIATSPRRLRPPELFIALLVTYSALFAARNIPLASILLTLIIAPLVAQIGERARQIASPAPVRALFSRLSQISKNTAAMEARFRGHALPLLALGLAIWVALHGGQLAGAQLMRSSFQAKRFPVAATDWVQRQNIREGLFAPDSWGGYLIYRLYPALHVFIDDRHDFYGEAFLKEYLHVVRVESGFEGILDRYRVDWVMVEPTSPLSNTLKHAAGWSVAYDDGVAIVFQRR